LLRDIPADGGQLEVHLTKDDQFAADNLARLQLPKLQPINVALSDSVPSAIAAVIKADPGLQVTALNQAQVVVQHTVDNQTTADNQTTPLPRLVLVEQQSQASVVVIGYTSEFASFNSVANGLYALGIEHTSQTSQAVQFIKQAQPEIRVWQQVFAASSDFIHKPEFPVFIARSLRYLAERPAAVAFAQAGSTLRVQDNQYTLGGNQRLASLSLDGQTYIPRVSNAQLGEQTISASLINHGLTTSTATVKSSSRFTGDVNDDGFSFFLPLLFITVLSLLGYEWWLYQRGLMP
jgi:hypothetical protein